MSLFLYEAVDARGKRLRGEIEADSELAARKKIKSQGLVPRRLEAGGSGGRLKGGQYFSRRFKVEDTLFFLQQLATLLEAGLPLSEVLSSIAEEGENRRVCRVVSALRQQVLEGNSLAQSMQAQGFDEIVCNMISAGEESGQLASVTMRLAELIEHRQRLRQELLSAALYPMLVILFGILVVIFLLAVVVPQIVSVFEHGGGELPWLTQLLIGSSRFVNEYGVLLLFLATGLVLLYRLAMRKDSLQDARDRMLLAIPGLGGLLGKIETAKFARSLGVLLNGGVPVLESMHIAIQSVSLTPIRRVLLAAGDGLREGEGLASRLSQSSHVPSMAVRMIAVGEQSGTLGTMLIRIANSYEEQGGRTLQRLVTLAEPLLVMLMAVVVGAIAMAILLPIMDMNELIR